MRPLKFYGRTMEEALARVRRELGADPLIIETRSIDPNSALGKLQAGARIEITAAVETPAAELPPRSFGHFVKQQVAAGNVEELLRLLAESTTGGAGAMKPKARKNSGDRTAGVSGGMAPAGEAGEVPEAAPGAEPGEPAVELKFRRSAASVEASNQKTVMEQGSAGNRQDDLGAADKTKVVSAPAIRVARRSADYARELASDADPRPSLRREIRRPLEQKLRIRPLLEDLAELKSQIRELVEESPKTDISEQADLRDYRFLAGQGVDPDLLRASFRRWLDERSGVCRGSTGASRAEAQNSELISFRHWLWTEWTRRIRAHEGPDGAGVREVGASQKGPMVTCLVGAHGVGKSTTLAKLASGFRQNQNKKVAILSVDNQRIGANEQWQRYSRLMDFEFVQAVTQEDAEVFMARADRFDWVGIDTPGGMTPESRSGRLYGHLLALCPEAETLQVLDSAARDQVNQLQMKMFQPFHPRQLVFSKLDLTHERGSLLNLTLNQSISPAWLATGPHVPEDLHRATPDCLWSLVFEPAGHSAADPAYGFAAGMQEAV